MTDGRSDARLANGGTSRQYVFTDVQMIIPRPGLAMIII